MFGKKKTWKPGIPKYKQKDLLTEEDKLNMAMNAVAEHELIKGGYKIVAANNNPAQIPSFICEKNGTVIFILVKCTVAPEMPTMSFEEKKHLLSHAEKHNAICYFAPVGIGATDAKRFEASLALKNDSYYINYVGLESIQSKISEEWLKQTLQEIDLLKPKEKKAESDIKYSLSDIRYSDRDIGSDFSIWIEKVKKKTFQEKLMELISSSGMTNQEFYKAALIDRKLFSAINTNPNYQPKKETAVACCFGLKLSLEDSEVLLGLAGYSFSMSIAWDRVVYYCIKKAIYDIDIVNELLYEEGEKCIRV